jgi:hypothetical protein
MIGRNPRDRTPLDDIHAVAWTVVTTAVDDEYALEKVGPAVISAAVDAALAATLYCDWCLMNLRDARWGLVLDWTDDGGGQERLCTQLAQVEKILTDHPDARIRQMDYLTVRLFADTLINGRPVCESHFHLADQMSH